MAVHTITWTDWSTLGCTLNSLASSATAGQKSANVATSGKSYAAIKVTAALGSGTIGNDKGLHVYLARSIDGSSYDDGLAAGDAAYTPANPPNLQYLGFVSTPVQSTTYVKHFIIDNPPPNFVVVVRNYSGIALAASGSGVTYSLGQDVIS